MEPKVGVIGRMKQAFSLYGKNFIPLSLAYFVVIFVFEVVLSNLFQFSILGNINLGDEEILSQIYTASTMIWIIVGIIGFLVYLAILIPVQISTIKGIQQAYNGEQITIRENIQYAVSNIINVFKIYWYIFAYVALMPLCIMIVGLLIILSGQLSGIALLQGLGGVVVAVASIILVIFAIYKGVKTTFSVYNAVEKNEYTKFNFQESVELTKDNWWRIVGNMIVFMIVVIIGSGIIGILSGLLGIGGSEIDFSGLAGKENISTEDIKALTDGAGEITISGILASVLNGIVQALISVFAIVFVYILFKRFQLENDDTIENISAQKKEQRNDDPKNGVIEEL